jgi:hypothetical protein
MSATSHTILFRIRVLARQRGGSGLPCISRLLRLCMFLFFLHLWQHRFTRSLSACRESLPSGIFWRLGNSSCCIAASYELSDMALLVSYFGVPAERAVSWDLCVFPGTVSPFSFPDSRRQMWAWQQVDGNKSPSGIMACFIASLFCIWGKASHCFHMMCCPLCVSATSSLLCV